MFRSLRIVCRYKNKCVTSQKRSFLTNDYKCSDAWNEQISSPLLNQIKLNDFYNTLEQNYATKGVISAIDIDIFANAIKDDTYLEELRDLLHKLRLSAETGNMLNSTHHAIVRNYIQFDRTHELIEILKDPLNYGVFLDYYAANILLDKLLSTRNYEQAANVASLIMLQEEFDNQITSALCQYAALKHIEGYTKPEDPSVEDNKGKKVEEIKIRIKYLRNPYFDDHFDIKQLYTLSGKTLAWVSAKSSDNLNNNLQLIGWLVYEKYENVIKLCEAFSEDSTAKVYPEVIELIKREATDKPEETQALLKGCVTLLSGVSPTKVSLEDSVKNAVENAINKIQNKDITEQQQLFKKWAVLRQQKLEEQMQRLDRAKRLQAIEETQNQLTEEEQKLWFFEKEDSIDLQIEQKEKLEDNSPNKKKVLETSDEGYIPPEILPKRK